MKIFFVNQEWSPLADRDSRMLARMKEGLMNLNFVKEVIAPELADVILIEEKGSFKNFRYIDDLLTDFVISRFPEKVFTINSDDCATGLLRGLYTSLPRSRFDKRIHASVPYMHYPNELVFSKGYGPRRPEYLASWRGNTKSNAMRLRMITALKSDSRFCLETTGRWLDHDRHEKEKYVDLILNSKFSLCPAGWAPVSFRIYESMALGRCPVILADEFLPPAGLDWNAFALFHPEEKMTALHSFLDRHADRYESLGRNALLHWEKFFSRGNVPAYFVQTLLNLIKHTPMTSKGREVRRWKSLRLFWSNQWTLPQRLINKARRLSKVLTA
jgi:Exostosin family.